MEFEEKKQSLIDTGHSLLSRTKKKDCFGIGSIDYVLSDVDIALLLSWYQRAEEFMEVYGLECQRERFREASWIINGERVSIKRIQVLLNIIESVKK